MSERWLTRWLWRVATVATIASVATWVWPNTGDTFDQPVTLSLAPAPTLFDDDSLMTAADAAIANDLFQPDRAAPLPPVAVVAPTVTPRPGTPRLFLRGMIGGPPWDMIIDGLPGRAAGTVIHDGETVDGLLVSVAARDTILIRGTDSSWVLVLHRR